MLFNMKSAHAALKHRFGLESFRPGQEDVLSAIAQEQNVLAVYATGFGKSLLYQLPACLVDGTVLVISPLISLMKDQARACEAVGLNAAAVYTGSIGADAAIQKFARGQLELLYIAPERIRNRVFAEALLSARVAMVVVDEAHCISRWGKDHRPAYQYIRGMVEEITSPTGGRPPVLLSTATCTPETELDIVSIMGLEGNYVKLMGDPTRPNIELNTASPSALYGLVTQRVKEHPQGRHLVYTWSRAQTEEVAEALRSRSIYALPYHAGLTMRAETQDRFTSGDIKVVVATNAFGMGVNIPDIRTIVHYGSPSSIEDYVQEIGRAGRDGLPSVAYLIQHPKATAFRWRNHATANPNYPDLERVYEALHRLRTEQGGAQMVKYSSFELGRALSLHSEHVETVMRYLEARRLLTCFSAMRGITIEVPSLPVLLAARGSGVAGRVAALLAEDMRVAGRDTFPIDTAQYAEQCAASPGQVQDALNVLADNRTIRQDQRFTGAFVQLHYPDSSSLPDVLTHAAVQEKSNTDGLKVKMMLAYPNMPEKPTFLKDYFQQPLTQVAHRYGVY